MIEISVLAERLPKVADHEKNQCDSFNQRANICIEKRLAGGYEIMFRNEWGHVVCRLVCVANVGHELLYRIPSGVNKYPCQFHMVY